MSFSDVNATKLWEGGHDSARTNQKVKIWCFRSILPQVDGGIKIPDQILQRRWDAPAARARGLSKASQRVPRAIATAGTTSGHRATSLDREVFECRQQWPL